MIKPILSTAKTILGAIYMLLFAVLLGVLAWGSHELYKNERTNRRFAEEGQLVTVQVTAVDRSSRAWYDQFANAAYVSFNHHGKRGEVRFKQDTTWVNEGSTIKVWYHPNLDAFRYPDKSIGFNARSDRSKLIRFTIVNQWNNERKWLLCTLFFAGIFLILTLTALAKLANLPPLKWTARLLVIAMLITALLYIIYNTAQYYRYYSAVKSGASEITVTVIDTDQVAAFRKSRWWYRYQATVAYPKGQKTIPIEEEQYEQLKPNDRLQVWYNSRLDDLMPVKYRPDHTNLYGCILVVALGVFFLWRYLFKRNAAV